MSPHPKPSVLLVDDNLFVRRMLTTELRDMGLDPVGAADEREAANRIEADDYPIVVVDVRMPGDDGVKLIQRIRARRPETKIIAMADRGAGDGEAVVGEADATLVKPFRMAVFREAVGRLLPRMERKPPRPPPMIANAG